MVSVSPPVRPGTVVTSSAGAQTHRPTPVTSNTSNIAGSSSDGGGFLDPARPVLVSDILGSKPSPAESPFPRPPVSCHVPVVQPQGLQPGWQLLVGLDKNLDKILN